LVPYVERPKRGLKYAGVATFRLMPDRRLEYGAVYGADLVSRMPFVPNDEIADIRWWDGTDIQALAALDAQICHILRSHEQGLVS
jgi:hypothetical protein